MTCETGKKEMDLVHQLQDQVSIFLFSSFYYIYIKRLQKKVKLHENSFMYQYEAYSFLKVTGFFKNVRRRVLCQIFDPIIVFFSIPKSKKLFLGYNEYVNYPWEDYSGGYSSQKPRLTRATSSRDSG